MYLLQQAIAQTGVLDRFESGRAKAWYDDSLMKSRIAFTVWIRDFFDACSFCKRGMQEG